MAFIAATDGDSASFVIGGVDGLLELFTWLAFKLKRSQKKEEDLKSNELPA